MPFWQRLLVVGVVIAVTLVVAKLVDRRIARRALAPETVTRYRVLRRSITSSIVALGLLSALLVVPQVRAIAGGILASSAIVGLVVGFAARSTLANFVAGLLIALTQPVRLGDRIEFAGAVGTVEEIGLTYTFVCTPDNDRLVIPNERLASDTIRNSTIRSREKLAEVTLPVPRAADLDAVVELMNRLLAERAGAEVLVTGLNDAATITLRAHAPDALAVERVASELRLAAQRQLRIAGIYA